MRPKESVLRALLSALVSILVTTSVPAASRVKQPLGTGELVVLDGEGRILRRHPDIGTPTSMTPLGDDTLLLTDRTQRRIAITDLEGHVQWTWRSPCCSMETVSATRLESGNILIAAGSSGAVEVDAAGRIVWRVKTPADRRVNAALRLVDGSTVLVVSPGEPVLYQVTPGAKEAEPVVIKELAPAGHASGGCLLDPDRLIVWDTTWPAAFIVQATGGRLELVDTIQAPRATCISPDHLGGFVFAQEDTLTLTHLDATGGSLSIPLPHPVTGIAPQAQAGPYIVSILRQPISSWPSSRPATPDRPRVSWAELVVWVALGILIAVGLHRLALRWPGRPPCLPADPPCCPLPTPSRLVCGLMLGLAAIAALLSAAGHSMLRSTHQPPWLAASLAAAACSAILLEIGRRRWVDHHDRYWQAFISVTPSLGSIPAVVTGSAVAIAGCALLLWFRQADAAATAQVGVWLVLLLVVAGLIALPDRTPSRGEPWRRIDTIMVAAALAVAAVTMLFRLREIPAHLHFDFVYNAVAAQELMEGRYASIWDEGFVPAPVIGLVPEMVGLKLAGPGELGFRLGGALFGLSGIVAMYILGRSYRGRATGFLAALLLSGNIPFIHFSRTGANGDSTTVALWTITLSVIAMRSGKTRWWLLAGSAAGYCFYLWPGSRVAVVACALWAVMLALRSPRAAARRIPGALLAAVALTVWLTPLVRLWQTSPRLAWPRVEQSLEVFKPSQGVDWERLEQSFGTPLYDSFQWFFDGHDNSTHGTITPGCNRFEATLLCVGLVIVLIEGFSVNVLLALYLVLVLLTLGAFAGSPPWYTRMVPSIPIAVLMMARSLTGMTDLVGAAWRRRRTLALGLGTFAVLVSALANMVAYTTAELTGKGTPPLPEMTAIGRAMRDLGPDYHFYLVVTGRLDWHLNAANPTARLGELLPFIWDLEVTEIRELEQSLPLPADQQAAVVVQAARADRDIALLMQHYPQAQLHPVTDWDGRAVAVIAVVNDGGGGAATHGIH